MITAGCSHAEPPPCFFLTKHSIERSPRFLCRTIRCIQNPNNFFCGEPFLAWQVCWQDSSSHGKPIPPPQRPVRSLPHGDPPMPLAMRRGLWGSVLKRHRHLHRTLQSQKAPKNVSKNSHPIAGWKTCWSKSKKSPQERSERRGLGYWPRHGFRWTAAGAFSSSICPV